MYTKITIWQGQLCLQDKSEVGYYASTPLSRINSGDRQLWIDSCSKLVLEKSLLLSPSERFCKNPVDRRKIYSLVNIGPLPPLPRFRHN